MAVNHFDLIVIGSGPAGERAASHAASLGKRVALVERETSLGGTVSNRGTLASKSMREAAAHLLGFRQRGVHGVDVSIRDQISAPDLLHRERLVRQLEQARIRAVLDQGHVALFHGAASFVDTQVLRVEGSEGMSSHELLSAQRILIASGSRPSRPEVLEVQDPRVLDLSTIGTMQELPRELVIVGGGVIGCEYACIFSAFGIRVVLLEEGDRLLPFLDHDLSDVLMNAMRGQGIDVRFHARVSGIRLNDSVVLELADGGLVPAERVLVCTGRVGNTESLNLPLAGIETDARGFIRVGLDGQTSQSTIYAAGDVVGFPSLASTARLQAVRAVNHALGQSGVASVPEIPLYGIYTIPECSMAGATEEELTRAGIPWVSGIAHYPGNLRGQIIGARAGFVKLLYHRESLELLGVHIIGEQASELVHLGVVAIQSRSKAAMFLNTAFNYPSLAEMYRSATLDALAKRKPDRLFGTMLKP